MGYTDRSVGGIRPNNLSISLPSVCHWWPWYSWLGCSLDNVVIPYLARSSFRVFTGSRVFQMGRNPANNQRSHEISIIRAPNQINSVGKCGEYTR